MVLFCVGTFLSGCGEEKKSNDTQTIATQEVTENIKVFDFSDVTWDTKKDDIINVVGKKTQKEGETATGAYSYYFDGVKFEEYTVETNYVYENDSLNLVIFVFRNVTESDYKKLEGLFTEKYGAGKTEGSAIKWVSANCVVALDKTPLGFGMLKVSYSKNNN